MKYKNKYKALYFPFLIIILLLGCRNNSNLKYQQNFINTIQQNELIDSLIRVLLKDYIHTEKATKVSNELTDYKTSIESKSPEQFTFEVNEILYEQTKDKHLKFFYDTTFTRSLIYKNMKTKNWNDRKYFEAYVKKDKELVSRNFEFEKIEILMGNIGYLKFNYFPTVGDGQETFEACLTFLKNSDALIIDLQDNRGGSLRMCEFLLSYFFDYKSTLFYQHFTDKQDTTRYFADKIDYLNRFKTIPLYILVGENTASAAEIFSNTMKEKVRGRVIGTTTWGGAHVCFYEVLNEAFSVLMPKSEILGANSKDNWEAKGIKPHNNIEEDDVMLFAHQTAIQQLLKKEKYNEGKKKYANILKVLKHQPDKQRTNLSKFNGTYASHRFLIKNNKLFWKRGNSRSVECIYVGENQFIAQNNSFTKIEFDKSLIRTNGVRIFKNNGLVKYYSKD